jgi:predicted phosphate transport protein (TIGR00153 family)
MASKGDRFYFTNFVEAADYACKAANYLVDCLMRYDPKKIRAMLESMHNFEHLADQKKHEMSIALAKAFVTPLDREDLADISQCIDEVTDSIEEVLQRFYIDNIQNVPPEAIEFAKMIAVCCNLMKDMMVELENFKKPDKLHKIIIELNHAEENCDRFYIDAAQNARMRYQAVFEVLSWREIFDHMESCADACEHVADVVETVVMKNT